MKRPLNPFDPAHPISPNQFVGRQEEVRELEAALAHAKRGRARHFLMTGERGVGKTSFLDYIRRRAASTTRGGDFNFLVVDCAINRNTTRLDLARAIKSQLERLLSEYAPFKDVLARAWSFIQRIEAVGVSIKVEEWRENHRDMYLEVADSLCEIVEKVCGGVRDGHVVGSGFDGLLVLMDEVDQASDDLDIGAFLKYLLERINRMDCHKVVFGLAGLSASTDVLVRSHPSSLRIFDELPLGNLSVNDVDELIAVAELKVRNEGFDEFMFSDEAKRYIFELSNGHPQFVHQFGYCAFEKGCGFDVRKNFVIERSHVMNGAFAKRGALDLIGDVYFKDAFVAVAENLDALAILDCLSESAGRSIQSVELQHLSSLGASATREALSSLEAVGFVVNLEGTGQYALRHPCLGLWVKARRPQLAI